MCIFIRWLTFPKYRVISRLQKLIMDQLRLQLYISELMMYLSIN